MAGAGKRPKPLCYRNWWNEVVDVKHKEDFELSVKFALLFDILRLCERTGEKLFYTPPHLSWGNP